MGILPMILPERRIWTTGKMPVPQKNGALKRTLLMCRCYPSAIQRAASLAQ